MSRGTLDPALRVHDFAYGAFTPSGRLSQNRSATIHMHLWQSVTPACTHAGLGSSPFARRYSGNRCFFLFLRVLRCFSSPGSLHTPMDSVHDDRSSSCRVPPFRDPRIVGYLLLPAAFRSLSRLSSALSAKASALRPYSLDLLQAPFGAWSTPSRVASRGEYLPSQPRRLQLKVV